MKFPRGNYQAIYQYSSSTETLYCLSINVLAFFHACRSLICYALVNKMTAVSWSFRSVVEEDLEKVLND